VAVDFNPAAQQSVVSEPCPEAICHGGNSIAIKIAGFVGMILGIGLVIAAALLCVPGSMSVFWCIMGGSLLLPSSLMALIGPKPLRESEVPPFIYERPWHPPSPIEYASL